MNLSNKIGAMVFGKEGNYIIGASDKTNEEFNAKANHCVDVKEDVLKSTMSMDTLEINKIEKICYNYNDILGINQMPKSCFSDSYGEKVKKNIYDLINKYSSGEISKDDLKKYFVDICKDMRVYHAQSRHTTGNDVKDNKQIVENVYEIFQKINVETMVTNCFAKGKEIAKENEGGSGNWIYYDSDFYYQAEELESLLQEFSGEMANEWNVGDIDYETIKEVSRYTLNGGLDFNSVWNWRASQTYRCSLDDMDFVPPEKFSLYYQESRPVNVGDGISLETQKGLCIILFGEKSWDLNVPFNNSVILGALEDNFRVDELFDLNNKKCESDLIDILSRFHVNTRFYGHNQTIREINKL